MQQFLGANVGHAGSMCQNENEGKQISQCSPAGDFRLIFLI